MFTQYGPAFVKTLIEQGFDVFLDLKYHDIPNTVATAVAAAAKLGVWMLNVHASGGVAMMQAAKAAVQGLQLERMPLLIAVTILTSLQHEDLSVLGISDPLPVVVERLAQASAKAGMDGVVCSAQEAKRLRGLCGQGFKLVTPGIRPAWATRDDQSRVMTPKEALQAGSDYLVVGRPITQASDPAQALVSILSDLEHT
jgi:orotidine-5'-phosphate decarboxylase